MVLDIGSGYGHAARKGAMQLYRLVVVPTTGLADLLQRHRQAFDS